MSRLSRSAKKRARNVAEEIAEEHGNPAAEQAREALCSDEMWCWLATASYQAGDYGHQRWKELEDDEIRRDELKSLLAEAELTLDEARSLREAQLIEQTVGEAEVA